MSVTPADVALAGVDLAAALVAAGEAVAAATTPEEQLVELERVQRRISDEIAKRQLPP